MENLSQLARWISQKFDLILPARDERRVVCTRNRPGEPAHEETIRYCSLRREESWAICRQVLDHDILPQVLDYRFGDQNVTLWSAESPIRSPSQTSTPRPVTVSTLDTSFISQANLTPPREEQAPFKLHLKSDINPNEELQVVEEEEEGQILTSETSVSSDTSESSLESHDTHDLSDELSLSSVSTDTNANLINPSTSKVKETQPQWEYKPRPAIRFISSDEAENRDNQDAGWDELKQLRTENDFERYAREKFGLRVPTDPKRNLTYHGYRRRLWAQSYNITKEWNDSIDRARRERRSLMLERGVLVNLDRGGKSVITGGKRKRNPFDPSLPEPPFKKRRFDEFADTFTETVYTLKYDFMCLKSSSPSRQETNWQRYLRHFEAGMTESKLFAQYYDDQPRMSEEEISSVLSTEILFFHFTKFYGPNPLFVCKDCEHNENSNGIVMHPF